MPKRKEFLFLPQVVIYLINVHQPCGEKHLHEMLAGTAAPKSIRGNVSPRLLRDVIKLLVNAKLILKTAEETYCVTERGLEQLAKARVAFPRDKFRLYFIKDALNLRDQ